MRLLLIRHAIAEDRTAFRLRGGLDDGQRPLTAKGRSRMKRAAAGLRPLAEDVTSLATSPLVRATQTARLVVAHARFPKPVEVAALSPEAEPQAFLDWLVAAQADPGAAGRSATDAIVAAVGHEPQLSTLIAWSLTGGDEPLGSLTKGGACLLRFDDRPSPGGARIEWLLRAGQLRRLRPRG